MTAAHPHAPTNSPSAFLAEPPSLQAFIDLPTRAFIDRYRLGVENFDRRIFQLKDDQLDMAFLPDTPGRTGRWPARVLLGHVADAELVFTHRMRRTFAEDHPVLAVFDENALIDAGMYNGPRHPIAAFVAAIHTLRRWTSEWMETLTPEHWPRTCLHPERGELTVRMIANYAAWHLEHHNWFLQRKVERLLGNG